LEDLSDASFLDKVLMLPAPIRLDWKVIARYKHTSLFDLVVSNEEKKFYNIDTRLTNIGGVPIIINTLVYMI
jgi:hypothetical protein